MDLSSYLLGRKSGGGGGTSDYSALTNKPSINGITLSGDKSTDDLLLESIHKLTGFSIDVLGLKKGVYVIDAKGRSNLSINFYYSPNREGVYNYGASLSSGILCVFEEVTNNMQVGKTFASFCQCSNGAFKVYTLAIREGASGVEAESVNSFDIVDGSNQYVYGTKTFSNIPKQSNTNAPTEDTQFTNKKYVDDSIASAITTTLGGSY